MAAVALVATAAALFFALRSRLFSRAPSEDETLGATRARAPRGAGDPAAGADGGAGASARSGSDARPSFKPKEPTKPDPNAPGTLWEKRLARARFTLDSYVEANKYPPESRPIEEHPDRVRPNDFTPAKLHLKRKDGKDTDILLTRYQSRFHMVGDESVVFTIKCETSEGPVPCKVASAQANAAPSEEKGRYTGPPVPLAFVDDGTGGDEKADDGTFTVTFEPSKTPLRTFHGRITIDLQLAPDQEDGTTTWYVEYTPSPPAVFTRKVREVLENGSLSLYVGIDVKRAGRFVITGRVDEDGGKSFAYLPFNEELAVGAQEVKLVVFGRLIRDRSPAFPLVLRDVEGFRLIPDAHPDRELMSLMAGKVHTTDSYRVSAFSEAVWDSEEKQRHVAEFTKDVKEAEAQVEQEKQK